MGRASSLTRLYARAPRHERANGAIPKNRGTPTMLIAPLTPRGVEAAMTLSGALNSFASEFFVEKILCPVLARNNVVVLDNLSAHKAASARALIAATSAEVVFLPPYSLDSNPIELAFSKIKQVMRSSAARTQEALDGRLPRQSRR